MGLIDRFKNRTVEDIVTTATDTVSTVVQTGIDDKIKKILYLLPAIAAAVIIFRSNEHKDSKDIPTKQVINNYYYYYASPERQGRRNVVDSNKGSR